MKDDFPLPKMDHILQNVVGEEIISTMYGFSGYNEIKLIPYDQEKNAFATSWGTFMCAKMPFGLMNVGATFQ